MAGSDLKVIAAHHFCIKWPEGAPLCAVTIDYGPESVFESIDPGTRSKVFGQCVRTLAGGLFWKGLTVDEAMAYLANEWWPDGNHVDFFPDWEQAHEAVLDVAQNGIVCNRGPCPEGYCERDKCDFPAAALEADWFDPGAPLSQSAQVQSKIGRGDKETQATILVRLVEESGAELWHTPAREPYITVAVSGHQENYRLDSEAARDWIGRLFYQEQRKITSNQSLYDALGVLRGRALFDGPEYSTYCRVARYDGLIYIDLGRSEWDAIEVSADGWQVIQQPPVRFIRPSELLPMPLPERGGTWDDLRALVNAQEQDTWILMMAWLVQAFWPGGPYAHLVLVGEQGSTKSTVSRILKRLADPSKGGLWGRPRDPQSLLIQALWARVVGLDNLSGVVDGWLSDTLCGLSTGTATGQRRLYTDFDQAILEVMRPALINGIDIILPRGDLADRAIVLELMPVKNRRRADEIEADFSRVWPEVLGLVLDATAAGLRNAEKVDLSDLPRMADFAAWIIACEEALPWDPGEFKAAYARNRLGRALEQVMIDPFARAIYDMLQENPDPITSTPAGFLAMLELRAGVDTARRPNGWPADPARLGTKLRRIAPTLRYAGISIEISKSDGKRMIWASLESDGNRDGRDGRGSVKGTVKTVGFDLRDGMDGNSYFNSVKKKGEDKESKREPDRKCGENTVRTVHTDPDQQAAHESDRDGNKVNRDGKGQYRDGTELKIIRVMIDLPQFAGTNGRIYGPFKPGDVATIPSLNAAGLIKKNAACLVNSSIKAAPGQISAELRDAVEELEKSGRPVVPFTLGQRLRRPMLGSVVQELKFLGYRETKEKDPASKMPLWRRAEA
ncbi:MAG: hypothetical protein A4E45_01757 [Methanosaeta sp. PtaB.Bin039]|nr:MAG: hypothetical protein A4E45_01757 [Methanosaeta sp. PtaB.Bin039]